MIDTASAASGKGACRSVTRWRWTLPLAPSLFTLITFKRPPDVQHLTRPYRHGGSATNLPTAAADGRSMMKIRLDHQCPQGLREAS